MQVASNQVWVRGTDEDVDNFADELKAIYNHPFNELKLRWRDDMMMAYYDTVNVPEPNVIQELSGRFPGLLIKMVGFEFISADMKGGWVFEAGECTFGRIYIMSVNASMLPSLNWAGELDLTLDDKQDVEPGPGVSWTSATNLRRFGFRNDEVAAEPL